MSQHIYLIITHNHSSFIKETFQSILNQYSSSEEFLNKAIVYVCDDCSKDNTVEILNLIQKKYNNVLIHINKTNKGISFNRNLLLDLASENHLSENSYLLFVDGDDILPQNSMNAKIKFLTENKNIDCVGGQIYVFNEDIHNTKKFDSFSLDSDLLKISQLFECHFYISNATFRASLFNNKKLRFSNLRTSEDWDFFSTHQLNLAHIPAFTLFYRRHSNNLTNLTQNIQEIFNIRNTIRNKQLKKINLQLSDSNYEILDFVSYLSLKFNIENNQVKEKDYIYLNWFNLLEKNEQFFINKEKYVSKIEQIFKAILRNNSIYKQYNQEKLELFLNTMIDKINNTKFELNQNQPILN